MSTEKLSCSLQIVISRKLILRLVSLSKVNSSFGVSLLKHSTMQSISVLLSFTFTLPIKIHFRCDFCARFHACVSSQ